MFKSIFQRLACRLVFRAALATALVVFLPATGGATVPGENGRIAFETTGNAPGSAIAVVDASGAGLRLLPLGLESGQPAWSPDGSLIAFAATDHLGNRHIYSVDFLHLPPEGSFIHRVVLTSGDGVEDSHPAWSPDGTKVAFTRCGGAPLDCDIWVVNANGSNPVNLTQDSAGDDSSPSWSPDGTKIAFSSDRNGAAEIFVMAADGTGQTGLTSAADDRFPDWSPDGTRILLARHDGQGASQVWVMNADGTSPTSLGAGDEPVFSPDGTRIAFIQALHPGTDLWAMNADGSGAAPLRTTADADESFPSWQPINPGTNAPPTANAGPDATFTCDSAETAARLDGSASTDPDSTPGTNDDILVYEWWIDVGLPTEQFQGTGPVMDQLGLPSGTYTITLQVTDSKGQTSIDSVVITIDDQTPPQISTTLDPNLLWPPNHRMVKITADVNAFDFCGPVTLVLQSVSSNESELMNGSGHTSPDIRGAEPGTPDFLFSVRAERSGTGDGRIYTAVYEATDPSGNSAEASGQVLVPHDQGKKDNPPGSNDDHGKHKGWNKGKGNGHGNH